MWYDEYEHSNKNSCIPKSIAIDYDMYQNYQINWPHIANVYFTQGDDIKNLKIKKNIEEFHLSTNEEHGEDPTLIIGNRTKDETDFNITYIPKTLIDLNFFGHIKLRDKSKFLNLKKLRCNTIDCDISFMTNLKSVMIDEYKGQYPVNLRKINTENFYMHQKIPNHLENIYVNAWVIYPNHELEECLDLFEEQISTSTNLAIDDFVKNNHKDYKSVTEHIQKLKLPDTINNYRLSGCVTECTKEYVEEVTTYLYNDTILPKKCRKLSLYGIKLIFPYNLTTDCEDLHISEDPHSNCLYIFNKNFKKVWHNMNPGSNTIFIGCTIKIFTINSEHLYKNFSKNCKIEVLVLNRFEGSYNDNIDFIKNNHIRKIRSGQNASINTLQHQISWAKLGYKYDGDLYEYTLGENC
jgi:hypothetical protein